MLRLRLGYRILLFVAGSMLLIAFVKNSSMNKVEAAEEVERLEETDDAGYKNTVKTIQLSIYDGDYSTYKSKLAKTIEVDARLSLEEKVQTVMESLSSALYKELPIEAKIEDRAGKKVAIINLVEPLSTDNREFNRMYDNLEDTSNTWKGYFSNGEARAIVTLASLQTTLEQPNYTGSWIDGYIIYHNGEALQDNVNEETGDITWIRR